MTGVILVGFGEPEDPSPGEVEAFLIRIFQANASLEDRPALERARELASARTPALIEEYSRIGGSPLCAQLRRQRDELADALQARGSEAPVFEANQFTPPSPAESVATAMEIGCRHLVVLPMYPLCGVSTTLAALSAIRVAATNAGLEGEVCGIAGWHRHSRYAALRADGISRFAHANGLDLLESNTRVLFSAHGTPMSYIERGIPYDRYVLESCEDVASALSVDSFLVGYQNHSNRGVEWTQPDVDLVVDAIDADRVVVVPISFMHEQSETLHELDIRLRARVEARGIEFHRVPVPHDHPDLGALLADLAEPLLEPHDVHGSSHHPCRCASAAGVWCLNREGPVA